MLPAPAHARACAPHTCRLSVRKASKAFEGETVAEDNLSEIRDGVHKSMESAFTNIARQGPSQCTGAAAAAAQEAAHPVSTRTHMCTRAQAGHAEKHGGGHACLQLA